MLVETEPRAMFQYSTVPILVSLLVLVSLIVVLLLLSKKRKQVAAVKVKPAAVNPEQIRTEYLAKIDNLIQAFQKQEVSSRQAYQNLSRLIRHFIFQVTGIKVQNYTLSEIKTLHLSSLTELVTEYYSPEFAHNSHGDFLVSAAKTRKVIELWH